tara:strand:- start:13735 stop:15195 length:1461 start_codon:yes stop_codon:yes gene_type:complete
MILDSNKHKIKEFLKLINSLNQYMINSKIWCYTRFGLGEIRQSNLFEILNNKKFNYQLFFLKTAYSIIIFISIIILFPLNYLKYKFNYHLTKKSFFQYFKRKSINRVFIAPVGIDGLLSGSHKKIFDRLVDKYQDIILIPIKPFKINLISFKENNLKKYKKRIDLGDIYLAEPKLLIGLISEIFYIIFMLLKIENKKLSGLNKKSLLFSFLESSLRNSYEIYALINLISLKLNKYKITFYTSFEANTFEKVLVKNRAKSSSYHTFNTCAILKIHTKHFFYRKLAKHPGFPDKIYTPNVNVFNASIKHFYKKFSSKIIIQTSKKRINYVKIKNFKYKFVLICEGTEYSDFLFKFAEQIINNKICSKEDIIISLHPSVPVSRFALFKIKKINLNTTYDLNKAIINSSLGVIVTSSGGLNALSTNMPIIKLSTNGIEDIIDPTSFINKKNKKIIKNHYLLTKEDLFNIKKILSKNTSQIRTKPSSWYYG